MSGAELEVLLCGEGLGVVPDVRDAYVVPQAELRVWGKETGNG